MIVDDVEGFLKFLDNVSLQLAYLLDIDSHQDGDSRATKRTQKVSTGQKSTKVPRSRSNGNRAATNKRQARLQQQQRPIRAKDRRKNSFQGSANSNEYMCSPEQINQQQQQQQQQQQHQQQQQQQQLDHHQDRFLTPIGDVNMQLNHSQAQQAHHVNHQDISAMKLQHSTHPNSDSTHTIDGQLTLGIADELQPLDHCTSISPTHLSPMESTIPFGTLHQQHYYTPQRGHLDSYQLHDEFNGHDTIPIPDSSTAHLSQDQQRVDHQHLIGHQQQSTAIRNNHALDNSDCYGQHHNHNHHHHIHQIHQHHQHNTHQNQYHQLDHQWIAATHDNDSNLQLGNTGAESSSLDHVVSMSPTTHQTIDQGQFAAPLYHHSYYNHQNEQLDSFQHISDDYANNTGPLTASSSSTPMAHLHRIDQQHQHQQQEQAQHHQHQSQLRMTNLSLNNVSSTNSYNQHNNLHNHPVNQLHIINEPYSNNHSQQQHHHHHHHQHQMMPLMNNLEPNGVIIQDINLAAASWSSPEDLYSI